MIQRFDLDLNGWLVGPAVYVVALGRRPLYIGATSNGLQRALMHVCPNPIRHCPLEPDRVHLFGFMSDIDALTAESWLIHELRPMANRMCQRRRPATPEFIKELALIAKDFDLVPRQWTSRQCHEHNNPTRYLL